MKFKSLNYSMDIVETRSSTLSIFLNPTNHNIDVNKKLVIKDFIWTIRT